MMLSAEDVGDPGLLIITREAGEGGAWFVSLHSLRKMLPVLPAPAKVSVTRSVLLTRLGSAEASLLGAFDQTSESPVCCCHPEPTSQIPCLLGP
ncbi:hypothetical protein NDU88_000524 [Pleurodeles waltl]|uniref:Uncharacterized protein n=1 Tax=Pleurodeles waltl TaxID=8319 RepID=A0AAV7R8Z3_PLEWA|nr:hypothetical protein NDU88_000524 [Pleurodeles waltl]